MKRFFLMAMLVMAMASLAPAATTNVSLTKVFPKVFSPDNGNRVLFYIDNPDGSEVSIRIFDITGNQVRQTVEWQDGGTKMYWDGRDQNGGIVSNGVYIYQLEADSKIVTGTVVVSR